ncbi:hypothetical protein TRVL_02829 [Trypanosoma vivax]|uniref:tRNA(Phe) 7-[(3-amino-3-carboxypropyl)-4-demethylwyosine(37)-N(4)]-methyltransferase n=1 Tax=Trypanosoma vivax (strain Y486) TaxID=1055687 RepID=G0U8F4_TRYVY|nr:hypothetical protein TRVL_02829 [Trypanosoma vivax]CCC53878.1 conserved hypothetical protein [Trypanosoma vivax Y486]
MESVPAEDDAAQLTPHTGTRPQSCAKEGKGKRCTRTKSAANSAGQSQREREFYAHKQRILANLLSNACDHSPKGGVDRHCLTLMQLLNNHKDYVTVSSCSGRIALFHSMRTAGSPEETDGDKPAVRVVGKRGCKDALGWLVVKHGELTAEEIDIIVNELCGAEKDGTTTGGMGRRQNAEDPQAELDGVWAPEGVWRPFPLPLPVAGTVALKMEPFVMHVACRTMESAKLLLTMASTGSGFRNSGVTPPGKRFICAIRHASGVGLDVPLVVDGENYARGQHAYVRRLLELANEKMRVNDARRVRLEKEVRAALSDDDGRGDKGLLS